MQGWKTILFSASLVIMGILQLPALSQVTGGCIFEANANQPTSCVVPGWAMALIGGVVFLLRLLTTTPAFTKTDPNK